MSRKLTKCIDAGNTMALSIVPGTKAGFQSLVLVFSVACSNVVSRRRRSDLVENRPRETAIDGPWLLTKAVGSLHGRERSECQRRIFWPLRIGHRKRPHDHLLMHKRSVGRLMRSGCVAGAYLSSMPHGRTLLRPGKTSTIW